MPCGHAQCDAHEAPEAPQRYDKLDYDNDNDNDHGANGIPYHP